MSYQSVILADSPVVYYEHEEASGTTATDASGNALNGTYSASDVTYRVAGPITEETSYGITTGGTSGRFTSAALATTNRPSYPFTVEAWIKPPSATPTQGHVYINLVSDDQGEDVKMRVGAGNLWELVVAVGLDDATVTAGVITGGWQHIVAVLSGDSARHLYVDGVLAGSETETGVAWTGEKTNYTLLGGWIGGPTHYPVSLSRSAVYDASLSSARIAAHFDAGRPYFGISGTLEVTPYVAGALDVTPYVDGALEVTPA